MIFRLKMGKEEVIIFSYGSIGIAAAKDEIGGSGR
jgi:hypothetical protein